jgi:hypothetical protein
MFAGKAPSSAEAEGMGLLIRIHGTDVCRWS